MTPAPILDGTPFTLPEVILPRPGSIVAYSDPGLDPGSIIGSSESLPAGRHRNVSIAAQAIETSGTLYLVFCVDANDNGTVDIGDADPLAAWEDGAPTILGIQYEAPPAPAALTHAAIDVGTKPLQSDGRTIIIPSATLDEPGFIGAWEAIYGATGEALGVSAYLPAGTLHDVAVTFPELLPASQPLAIGVMLDDPDEGRQRVFDAAFDHIVGGMDGLGVWAEAEVVVLVADPDPGAEQFVSDALPEPDALGPDWASLSDEFIEPLTRPPANRVSASEVKRKKPPATCVMRASASAAPRPLINAPPPPPPMPRAPPSERCSNTKPMRHTQTSKWMLRMISCIEFPPKARRAPSNPRQTWARAKGRSIPETHHKHQTPALHPSGCSRMGQNDAREVRRLEAGAAN